MNKLRRSLIWLLLLQKRLLCKKSFWVTLLLIPLAVLGMRVLARQDSGMLHILLCIQEENQAVASDIVRELTEADGILRFSVCGNARAAREQVACGQADAAWIFPNDMEARISSFAAGGGEALCLAVERETTVSLQLAHEKLYGALFPWVCRAVYTEYIRTQVDADADAALLQSLYDAQPLGDNFLQLETLSGEAVGESADYLTLPLRGMLSLCVLLCAFAAAAAFLEERTAGVYAAFSPSVGQRILFGTTAVAALDAGLAVLAAQAVTDGALPALRELAAMGVLVLTSALFAAVCALLAGSAGRLCAALPPLLLAIGAVSPIFFRLDGLRAVQMLFPPYYYLRGAYSAACLRQGVWYAALLGLLFWAIGALLCRRRGKTV